MFRILRGPRPILAPVDDMEPCLALARNEFEARLPMGLELLLWARTGLVRPAGSASGRQSLGWDTVIYESIRARPGQEPPVP